MLVEKQVNYSNFSNLSDGTMFIYRREGAEDTYCIKIDAIMDNHGEEYNAVCLETGEIYCFRPYDDVIPVHTAKIIF